MLQSEMLLYRETKIAYDKQTLHEWQYIRFVKKKPSSKVHMKKATPEVLRVNKLSGSTHIDVVYKAAEVCAYNRQFELMNIKPAEHIKCATRLYMFEWQMNLREKTMVEYDRIVSSALTSNEEWINIGEGSCGNVWKCTDDEDGIEKQVLSSSHWRTCMHVHITNKLFELH